MIQEPTRFWKGVKKDVAPRLLEEGYLQDGLNVHAKDGALRKRNGFRLVHVTSVLSGALSWPTLLWSMFLPESGIGQEDTGGGGPSSESEDIPIDDPNTVDSISLPDPSALTGDDPEKDDVKGLLSAIKVVSVVTSCVPFNLKMYRGAIGEDVIPTWSATCDVSLSLEDGTPVNLNTGWEKGQWSYGGVRFGEKWENDVVDFENTAEKETMLITLSGVAGTLTTEVTKDIDLYHPIFVVNIPASVTAGTAFTMTLTAKSPRDSSVLDDYIGEGADITLVAYTGSSAGGAWEELGAFTKADGSAIDLTTGWTDGVWSQSVKATYAGPHDRLKVQATYPKNRADSDGYTYDTATLVASNTRLLAVLPDSVVADASFLLTIYGDSVDGTGVSVTVTERLASTGASVAVALTDVTGTAVDFTTGWTQGTYFVGGSQYTSRWQAYVIDPVNTAEYDTLRVYPQKAGYFSEAIDTTLYHPTFQPAIPDTALSDVPFVMTITAQNPISGATLTSYNIAAGDGVTLTGAVGDNVSTWEDIETFTMSDGDPIDLSTGWLNGVWTGSVKFVYEGAQTHFKATATYPKNRAVSDGYSSDTALIYVVTLNLENAIYERQLAAGITNPWDSEDPANPANLIDTTATYTYNLAEYKAYLNAIAPSYIQNNAYAGGASLPAVWDGTYADTAIDELEIFLLLSELQKTIETGVTSEASLAYMCDGYAGGTSAESIVVARQTYLEDTQSIVSYGYNAIQAGIGVRSKTPNPGTFAMSTNSPVLFKISGDMPPTGMPIDSIAFFAYTSIAPVPSYIKGEPIVSPIEVFDDFDKGLTENEFSLIVSRPGPFLTRPVSSGEAWDHSFIPSLPSEDPVVDSLGGPTYISKGFSAQSFFCVVSWAFSDL